VKNGMGRIGISSEVSVRFAHMDKSTECTACKEVGKEMCSAGVTGEMRIGDSRRRFMLETTINHPEIKAQRNRD